MGRLRSHLAHALGTLLLLETIQVVTETIALAWVYRGQILPPYSFFPTQLYDFLAKLRYLIGDRIVWLPDLPESFLPTAAFHHLAVFAALLPMGTAMAIVVGLAIGFVGALLTRGAKPSTRAYVLVWLVLGLGVHTAMMIPPLELGESAGLRQVIYRARSLVLDGTLVSLVVFAISVLATWLLAPRLARSRSRLTAPGLATAVLVASLGLGLTGGGPERPAETAAVPQLAASTTTPKYNVVLISIDSLRADHVGCYGYSRNTTPAIDRLASQGVRFAEAISTSSWTLPTHLSIFTSRYQISHGVMHESYKLSEAVPTLGEVMSAAGYATAGFVSAPYVAAHYGYARGMDVYRDLSREYGHRREARSAIVSEELTKLAVDWIDKQKDRPFFLFYHNFDAHYDYTPPPPYDRMFDPDYDGDVDGNHFIESKAVNPHMDRRDLDHIISLYDGEIRYIDDHIALLLKKLDDLGLRRKTLVLLVSDHGDEFFEHGNKGHHRTLYDEVLDVPMIVRLPTGAHAGTVVDEPVSLIDLMPTILDYAEVPAPEGLQGLSLVPLMAGRPSGRSALYSLFFDKRGLNLQAARRTQSSKVIQHFNRITHPSRRPTELYDLESDPSEQNDLAATDPAETRRQLDILAGFLEEQWLVNRRLEHLSAGGNRVEIDADTMEALKALGYVGD
jgi:arylsulfatase A-like enzyme